MYLIQNTQIFTFNTAMLSVFIEDLDTFLMLPGGSHL